MVELEATDLDLTFHALGSPVRREILAMLIRDSQPVGELARRFEISLNGTSKHLKVLERAGLVRRSRKGRVHRMSFEPQPLEKAARAIAFYRQFWEDQLDGLARYLENPTSDNERHETEH